MADPKWQAVIDKNRALARQLGISGTTGFIVGKRISRRVVGSEGTERINCPGKAKKIGKNISVM